MNDAATPPVLDAFIVGAGPVGLATGCALRAAGLTVQVADAGSAERALEDSRVIALSAGSRDILRTLQAWPAADATPIGTIHISQRGHFGRTELRAADFGLDALGHVARAGSLVRALRTRAAALDLDIRYGSRSQVRARTVMRSRYPPPTARYGHAYCCGAKAGSPMTRRWRAAATTASTR